MTEGRHASDAHPRRRRNAIVVAAIVVGLLVFVLGYVLGSNGGEAAASVSPSPAVSPTGAPTSHPSPHPTSSPLPSGEELPDGRYFVRLHDLQDGDAGEKLIRYDLAYYYTGDEANQVAASRGDETPVPNDVYIVNDNPKLRTAPLETDFTVRYIPVGSTATDPVLGSQDRFFLWISGTAPTDFPSRNTSYWWITIHSDEVTTIEQQYQP